MKNYVLHIPEGVRDYLWEESYLKQQIEDKTRKLFTSYSYNLIETPTFEYLDVFTLGDESYQNPKLYKWMNKQGEIVALRSDMTRSIARVVATQNSNRPMPQRYQYVSNSFRYPERYQGKVHEFTQAGIELIGASSIEADVEVINLAIEAMEAVGIEDFTIHLGSAKFLECLLKDIGATKEQQAKIYEAIDKKDAVKVQDILRDTQATEALIDVISKLMQQVGGIELLEKVKAQPFSQATLHTLEELENIYKALVEDNKAEYILFDFSILSYASYYTGMMFQGYTEGIGEAVIEGGRYDKLLAYFGVDVPAVGFGLNIYAVLQQVKSNKQPTLPAKTLMICEPETRKIMKQIATQFRQEGLVVEQSVAKGLEEALDYAIAAEIGGVLHFKNEEEVDVYDLAGRTVQTVALTSLQEEGE